MSRDFVFPKNNEKEFITIAKKLAITEIVFIYKTLPKTKRLLDTKSKNIKIAYATLLDKQPKKQEALLLTNNSDKIRMAAEHPAVNGVFGIEKHQKDFIHHRGSGMNQVIAKMLKKNNKFYMVDWSMVLNATQKQQAKLLGRIKQNIKLCKKYKVKIIVASCARTPYELRSPKDLKAVLRFLEKK